MIGEQLIINTDPEALQRDLIAAMDTIIGDSLRAFGITFADAKELEGRLRKQRHVDWEPGRFTYFVDNQPFLNMTARHSPQTVRLSWVSIDRS